MDSQFAQELMNVSMEFGRIMRQRMSCVFGDVNVLHIHTLAFLQDQPGMTMKELAKILHITSPSATALVQRMVNDGVVERFNDEHNRKLVRLRTTEKGSDLFRQKMEEKNEELVKVLSGVPPRDQEALLRIMRTIISATHTPSTPSPSPSV